MGLAPTRAVSLLGPCSPLVSTLTQTAGELPQGGRWGCYAEVASGAAASVAGSGRVQPS